MQTPSPRLLIIEDDPDFCETLLLEFQERHYIVETAANLNHLHTILEAAEPFRFALLDLRLKGDSGLDLISPLLSHSPDCRIVILTGYGSIATAVEALKRGAVNYLTKPAPIERIEQALWIDGVTENAEISEENEPISLDRHEQEYLEYVLLQCQGNISQAARWLGIHRQSLQRKLKRTGLR